MLTTNDNLFNSNPQQIKSSLFSPSNPRVNTQQRNPLCSCDCCYGDNICCECNNDPQKLHSCRNRALGEEKYPYASGVNHIVKTYSELSIINKWSFGSEELYDGITRVKEADRKYSIEFDSLNSSAYYSEEEE